MTGHGRRKNGANRWAGLVMTMLVASSSDASVRELGLEYDASNRMLLAEGQLALSGSAWAAFEVEGVAEATGRTTTVAPSRSSTVLQPDPTVGIGFDTTLASTPWASDRIRASGRIRWDAEGPALLASFALPPAAHRPVALALGMGALVQPGRPASTVATIVGASRALHAAIGAGSNDAAWLGIAWTGRLGALHWSASAARELRPGASTRMAASLGWRRPPWRLGLEAALGPARAKSLVEAASEIDDAFLPLAEAPRLRLVGSVVF